MPATKVVGWSLRLFIKKIIVGVVVVKRGIYTMKLNGKCYGQWLRHYISNVSFIRSDDTAPYTQTHTVFFTDSSWRKEVYVHLIIIFAIYDAQ